MKNKLTFKNIHTMVGPDAEIRGDINLNEGLIIYGKVYGSVSSKGDIQIGKTGKVYGDIKAKNIHVGGEVFGNVTIEDRAELGKHSTLDGDLIYKQLHIEQGAKFQGQCTILNDQDNRNRGLKDSST
ncbi:MAG: polymer-forming cytoskeletal protein [Candidatus Marinimicrobia bacterium]|nr:polymer-forming cytoskeletal protein [Candidatus Neomarinimicrobiota bacterium]